MSTTAITARPYAGAHDLRRMQDAVSRRFGPGVTHPGDLAWWTRDQGHVHLASQVTVLESPDGEVLGFTWLHLNGWFDAVAAVDPDATLATAMVDAALDSAARLTAAGDPLPTLSVLYDASAEPEIAAALAAREFAADTAGELYEVTRRDLHDLPDPNPLPAGLRFAPVDDDLVHAKVECHRAAFAPSSVTVIGYRRVRRTWPYRPELDRVVVDDAGTVLATCLAWIDEATGWGLFEPVGTRPEHQRRGLATAVCLDALHALRDAGATHAQVGCETGSAGCRTYHGLGFTTEHRMGVMRRPFTH